MNTADRFVKQCQMAWLDTLTSAHRKLVHERGIASLDPLPFGQWLDRHGLSVKFRAARAVDDPAYTHELNPMFPDLEGLILEPRDDAQPQGTTRLW